MPVPHFNIKITQRSKGNSAVAGAAYQAGEKLFSEYDQKTKNYTCKKEVVYTEIMLPPNAPPEYADRAALWNSVEEIEKQWNSQLARRFVAALPREVPMELFCLVAIVALASCGSNKLPEWADTEVLTENARVLIDTLNDFDYEGVAKIYNNPAVDASTFEASGKTIESLGAFEDYGDVSFASGKTDDGKEFVRVIQIANYESGKLTYNIDVM